MPRKPRIDGAGNVIKSFSYPTTKQVVIDEINKIANKENFYFSEILVLALEEYAKTHGDGNPAFTIDQWFDEGFQACPAFFRSPSDWRKYIDNADPRTLTDLKDQIIRVDHILGAKLSTGSAYSKAF
jgi:hypothetical protein